MAINISQAFHRTSANPIDDTLALTKAEMLTVNDNLMPSKYLTVCQDDGQIYLYDKSATPSAETGKFILFEAGGGGGSVPIGLVAPFMATTAPTNYLACDGTIYNISDYPKLANFFERQFGTKNHFGGDGTTTFAVPNLNGEFLRGTGTNGHTNQGSGANVGVHQDATNFPNIGTARSAENGLYAIKQSEASPITNSDSTHTAGSGAFTLTNGGTWASGANVYVTSRPTNTSVLFCICARTEETEPTGHEYSTTEQVVGTWIDGKPIYEKTINFGALPADNNGKNVSTGLLASSIDMVIHIDGFSYTTDYRKVSRTLPYSYVKDPHNIHVGWWTQINGDYIHIYCMTSYDRSNENAYVTIQYTKTTD